MADNILFVYLTCLLVITGVYLISIVYLISSISLPTAGGIIFNAFLLLSGQLVLTIITWFVVKFLYYFYYRNETVDVAGKTVLITGCDSGFGLRTAIRLDKLGFRVFATVLDVDGPGAIQMRQECSKRVKICRMDARNDQDIQNIVNQVSNCQLWALVNNAGVARMSFFEFNDNQLNDFCSTFDVNLLGPAKLIKLLLPQLRQSKGRIVNMTSIAAQKSSFPIAYCSSKHAMRAFSNGLRIELAPFGVNVICVEPGPVKTPIITDMKDIADRCLKKANPNCVDDYQSVIGDVRAGFHRNIDLINRWASSDIDAVPAAVEKAVVGKRPQLCYRVVGGGVWPAIWQLVIAMPDEISQFCENLFFNQLFNVKKN